MMTLSPKEELENNEDNPEKQTEEPKIKLRRKGFTKAGGRSDATIVTRCM